jgi:hypothetical protein
VLQRVREQYREDLAQADRVHVDGWKRGRHVDRERQFGRFEPRLEHRADVADERGHIGRLPMQRKDPALRLRQRLQLLDQRGQDTRLLQHRKEVGVVARVDALDQALEVALDDGERRAQLVRDVGQETPPLLVVRLEALGHLIERAGEATDLRRPALGDAHRVVARSDPSRRVH